jgi:hypothetical protein
MTVYADLELGLRRQGSAGYTVDLRYSQPGSDADLRLAHRNGDDLPTEFDHEHLRELAYDPVAYGQLLGKNLLSDPEIRMALEQARASAQTLAATLRVRLLIDPSASELHSLYWETLCDPRTGTPLFTGENIVFSRYLSSFDWRPIHLRPQSELKALIVVANPIGLDKYDLPPADVPRELSAVQDNLGGIRSTALASNGSANLNNIIAQLRDGYDVLYLICHGSTRKGDTYLWLEDEAGNVSRISGGDIVTRLNELQQRPRLIVLATCQSASQSEEARTADDGALVALGPRLAEAGIPAVVAMQGSVTVRTIAQFMPIFFRELQRDGQIDRAMAVARGAVRDRPDWWMPTLFMRLKSGRIWYVPGFGDERQGFEKWPALLRSIRTERCTPILGFGVLDSLLGSTREIARRWAETYRYPLAPDERDELPQVAQFLSVNQDHNFPRDELGEYLRRELQQRYQPDLPAELQTGRASLDQIVKAIGAKRRAANPHDPQRVLARQPFSIYITTTADDLLTEALREAGKDPQIALCPWNEYVEISNAEGEADYRPTPERPLVYHLFGRLSEPDSLVITEDDYFDYLIGVTSNKDLIPSEVRRRLADTALLFLGFDLDSWDFRVLYRSLMGQEGRERRSRYAHIAAQIDPEGGRLIEPERARQYLEQYFRDADISIYWGSAEDFLSELDRRAGEQ